MAAPTEADDQPDIRRAVGRPSAVPSPWLRWMSFAALVIALAALGLSGWAVFRPTSSTPSYSADDIGKATTAICAAYDLASRGVAVQTNKEVPSDQSGVVAVQASARLALAVSSDDLRSAIDASQAAPAGLRDAVGELATQYRVIAANYLAGSGNEAPPVVEAFARAKAADVTIGATCKK